MVRSGTGARASHVVSSLNALTKDSSGDVAEADANVTRAGT